jgi:hypothetical protein
MQARRSRDLRRTHQTQKHAPASACNPSAGSSYVSAFLQLYMLPGRVSPKPRLPRPAAPTPPAQH